MEHFYDTMASIIRALIDDNVKLDKLNAVSRLSRESSQKQIENLLKSNEKVEDIANSILQAEEKDYGLLSVLLCRLDELACEFRKNEKIRTVLDFNGIECIESLNSQESRQATGILLIPRYSCIWEGKSRQANHRLDINTLLKYTYSVQLEEGKVAGKYGICNYILDEGLYKTCINNNNELVIPVGISPLLESVNLQCDKYQDNDNGFMVNYFAVNPFEKEMEQCLICSVKKVIEKADKSGCEVLVFPEMLGTNRLIEEVQEMLENQSLINIKILVLPSVWTKNSNWHEHTNQCCVMDYTGKILFMQDKLKRFPWDDKETQERYLEDIVEANMIHLIHNNGYGSVAIAICRSELDEEIRDILIKDLNVKLLLCPSWSTGHFSFENSIMSGAERDCNTVWCNTCSALENKMNKNKKIGIISGYGKNREWSQSDLANRSFPAESICLEDEEKKLRMISDRDEYNRKQTEIEQKKRNPLICKHQCAKCCYFIERIYGTDYTEESQVILL